MLKLLEMLTVNVSKIKKSVLPNIIFIVKVLSQNEMVSDKISLFLRSKNNFNFTKTYFLKRDYVCMRNYSKCIHNLYISVSYIVQHIYDSHREVITF